MLTKEEMETTMNYDENSPNADVLTYNKALQRRIETRVGINPYLNNGFGGRLYTIPKKLITIRIPRKMSAEQRKKAGERLAQARQKSPNPSKSHITKGKSQGEKKNKSLTSSKKRKA